KGHKNGGEHDARNGENDLYALALEKWAEIALGPEQEHIDQSRNHRRDREGKVYQRVEDALAWELELGDRPGGRQTEDDVGRNRDRGHEQGELDGGERVGLDQRRKVSPHALV